VALSWLFTIYVISGVGNTFTQIEIVLAIWFGTALFEDLRLIWSTRTEILRRSVRQNMRAARDFFVILEMVILLLYWSGLIVRVCDLKNSTVQFAAHTIHCLLALPLWLRLARFYAVSSTLGPRLIVVARMMKDVFTFIMFLALVILGYGSAIEGLLYPYQTLDPQGAADVVFRPYFHIFGDLMLDEYSVGSGGQGREMKHAIDLLFVLFPPTARIWLCGLLSL
jgi:hypothetical protein